jgi:hypothetical protein
MLVDQITPRLLEDNEEINAHVKHLQSMLDTATVVDPALDRDDEARGHKNDHRQSPCGDLASSLTPPKECGQRRGRDDQDLCDVIRGRDAHGRIENRHQERERIKQE